MSSNELQIDFQKVIAKYNSQLGDAFGRIAILEAETETLRDYITGLEAKLASVENADSAEPAKARAK